jgi:hypothetical protein
MRPTASGSRWAFVTPWLSVGLDTILDALYLLPLDD